MIDNLIFLQDVYIKHYIYINRSTVLSINNNRNKRHNNTDQDI